jgi:hypothetical protein
MKTLTFVSTLAAASVIWIAASAAIEPTRLEEDAAVNESGDHPLEIVFSMSGEIGVALDVGPGSEGVFEISGIPMTAQIEKAFFISGTWTTDAAPSVPFLTFNGLAYGRIAPTNVDESPDWNLWGFLVDVTANVFGNGTQTFTFYDAEALQHGSLLAVIYSDDSLPAQRIDIAHGAESLQLGTSTASFPSLAGGAGTIQVFVQADGTVSSAGEESIRLNGNLVLGGLGADIFDGSDAGDGVLDFASLNSVAVTTIEGLNAVSITTGQDWFGLHSIVFESPLVPTSVEETSWRSWGRIKSGYR